METKPKNLTAQKLIEPEPQSRRPNNLKIVFFGNTKYSVLGAEIIHKKFPLSLVVTIPDKPSGRKKELKPSPVKKLAQENNIPVLETDKLDDKAIGEIGEIGDVGGKNDRPDFLIVEDYGLILPESLLEIPRYAPLNIHHSLLPKYRGPSPAPSAILNGEKVSGVTIISMTEQVDAGDMLAQQKYGLAPTETTDSLLTELNKLGGDLVLKVIEDYINGNEKPIAQNDKQATYTKRLSKQDGYIDIDNPPDPKTLDRMIRAYYPWPGTWCRLMVNGKWLIVKFLPGNLIQPESKRPLTVNEFKNGYPEIYKQLEQLL